MRNPWNVVRCTLNIRHRWQPISADGHRARECRDCGRRDFLGRGGGPDDRDAMRDIGAGAGGVGGIQGGM
jgi:hypothetical protein